MNGIVGGWIWALVSVERVQTMSGTDSVSGIPHLKSVSAVYHSLSPISSSAK